MSNNHTQPDKPVRTDLEFPSKDLRTKARDILDWALDGKSIGISRFGRLEAVVISAKRYEQLLAAEAFWKKSIKGEGK